MTDQLVNDGQRYSITIDNYFHQENYVIYAATIIDQCFNYSYQIFFRYKTLKSIHQKLLKYDAIKHFLPEFPKTRSFFFVNKTNHNSKNIQDRARQLQYYMSKLLNTKQLSNINEVKNILFKAKHSLSFKKSKSETKILKIQNRKTSSLSKIHIGSSNTPLNQKYL